MKHAFVYPELRRRKNARINQGFLFVHQHTHTHTLDEHRTFTRHGEVRRAIYVRDADAANAAADASLLCLLPLPPPLLLLLLLLLRLCPFVTGGDDGEPASAPHPLLCTCSEPAKPGSCACCCCRWACSCATASSVHVLLSRRWDRPPFSPAADVDTTTRGCGCCAPCPAAGGSMLIMRCEPRHCAFCCVALRNVEGCAESAARMNSPSSSSAAAATGAVGCGSDSCCWWWWGCCCRCRATIGFMRVKELPSP